MTSQTDDALVEAIASAMWEYDNALFAHHNIAEMQSIAHAAIAAVRAHDEARGMVLVPREPTEAMARTFNNERALTYSFSMAYTAMLSASREGD